MTKYSRFINDIASGDGEPLQAATIVSLLLIPPLAAVWLRVE
jgi:hypothetical protein